MEMFKGRWMGCSNMQGSHLGARAELSPSPTAISDTLRVLIDAIERMTYAANKLSLVSE